ncbi:hypothetical protein [Salicibibacter cibarius]|nr:hypothetical protein [Salicibibacter cibarius]
MEATENILSLVLVVVPLFYQRTGCFLLFSDKKSAENPDFTRVYL